MMSGDSKTKMSTFESVMESKAQVHKEEGFCKKSSKLLDLSASDDLEGFICEIESKCFDVEEVSHWYGRRSGTKKMGFEERSPLMIAATYGSTEVLKYIIGSGNVDVNRACGSDGATALHCAAAGGSASSVEVVRILLDASADASVADANGNKPCDLIDPHLKFLSNQKKVLRMLLKGRGLSSISIDESSDQEQENQNVNPLSKEGIEKKDYPVDVSLPDINSGVYVTDEFRMYSFKITPCSRAYSHDWTECPFVHPGENARRRDPRKCQYSCVPCPDFKKGTCVKGDTCEYAHGVFESWLHPAQYRTRLCKDETGCSRKVCFFAHKPEELRPLYASTGSGMPSPASVSASSIETKTLSPLSLRSSSLLLPAISTAPMSPSPACSSPIGGAMKQNQVNLSPKTLQLPGSRLKTAVSARDMELELLGLRQQLIDGMSCALPSSWNNEFGRIGNLKPTNLDDVFGSLNPSLPSQCQSSTSFKTRQNANQVRSSYPSNFSSKPSTFRFDTSGALAAAVMNSRSCAFSKRSQSFIDRRQVSHPPGFTVPTNSATSVQSNLSDWGSPDGKLDWGYNGGEMNKLKKSVSFGLRNGTAATNRTPVSLTNIEKPDVSWVHSLVNDVSSVGAGLYGSEQKHGGVNKMFPSSLEQLYIEQEQTVA